MVFVSAFWKIVDVLLPPRCLVTGDVVDRQGMLSPEAWARLDFIGPPYCDACGYPFDFDAGGITLCALCVRKPPAYTKARHAMRYNDSTSDIVLRFKYADQTYASKPLAQWLQRAAADFMGDVDVIVPVPLHPLRLWARRYNQAALLAQALARQVEKPCLAQALQRRRATEKQGRKSFRARHRNVRKAFAVNAACKAALAGKAVLLVDDVYTSGATIRECTKTLHAAGVRAVYVVTLARVVRPLVVA